MAKLFKSKLANPNVCITFLHSAIFNDRSSTPRCDTIFTLRQSTIKQLPDR